MNLKRVAVTIPAGLLLVAAISVRASVPSMINYQGSIKADGASFTGTGYFKFAIVTADGSTTYWSNDGTSAGGSEPADAVEVSVSGGLYSVKLGDASIANMTSIPESVFTHRDVYLRVWFDDGTRGSQLLSPDSRIASAAYSYQSSFGDGATVVAAADGSGDYTGIQEAIDALPAGGGLVRIKEGTYSVSESITLPTGVSLEGAGAATVIYLADNSDNHVMKNSDAAGGNSNIRIANLTINGNKAANEGSLGILFDNVTGSVIENCRIHDCDDSGIKLTDSTENMISRVQAWDCDAYGITLSGSSRNEIVSNRCEGNAYTNIYLHNTSNDNILSANICRGSQTHHGIAVKDSDDNIISSNRCRNNNEYGVEIYTAGCDRTLVHGNNLRNNTSGALDDNGTGTTSADNVT